jgi:hypothetical protein
MAERRSAVKQDALPGAARAGTRLSWPLNGIVIYRSVLMRESVVQTPGEAADAIRFKAWASLLALVKLAGKVLLMSR